MTTETIRLRSELINTKVITNNTAKQLGVVKTLLVDIDRREVIALGLKDNFLAMSGMSSYMYLNSIEKIGDVVLVPHEDVIEDIDIELFSNLINCEVITETGEPIGRVRDFQFSIQDGRLTSLILATIGLPQIPDQVLSTYQLSVEEIVSSGPNRIIVFEGAEERLVQMTVGMLERLGIGRPPWERGEEDPYYAPTVKVENQLPSGVPLRTPAPPLEKRQPAWDEDEWEEAQPRSLPRRQAKELRYQEITPEYEESNWEEPKEAPAPRVERQRAYMDATYEDVSNDVWEDEGSSYQPPKVNIPEKTKTPEYEEG